MAIQDLFNSDRFSLGSDYNPTQSNVLGQNLAPVNAQGQLAAVDADNDNRTPEQFKLDARLAETSVTNAPDEDDNYIKSSNGNRYEKVDDSDWHGALSAAANYMSTYFATGGNVGAAGQAAGKAVYDLQAKAHRLSQVDQAEATGANPLDVQNWINSGDKKDLITNKGSWTSGGNGTMFNTLTGETRVVPGAVNTGVPVKTANLGDRVIEYYADGTTKERTRGLSPSDQITVAGASVPTGGSDGLDSPDEDTPAQQNGIFGYYDRKGSFKPLGTKEQEYWRGQAQASTGAVTDPNQKLVSDDLTTINAATPEQIDRFTGQIVGRSTTARDIASSLDPETRKVYQASERLGTQLGNAAISAAKAAGASGINTEAEIKRFTAGVPQPDYTSKANYDASMLKIQQYAEDFKADLIRKAGGKAQAQPQQKQQLSDEELLKKYGG
ncbi:hypothetical protein CDG24_25225 [Salmonella enterica subsp. enterica serovar Newport]|nr:hypothetical protein [Salmonella enterica subsp. enterica serovar Newport]